MFLDLVDEKKFFDIIMKFFYVSKNVFIMNMGIHAVIIYFAY